MRALRAFTNLLYMTPTWVRRYRAAHPEETVLAAAPTKRIRTSEDAPVRTGLSWVFSKRGTLILTDQALVCGSERLPLEDIAAASYVEGKSLLSKGLVLKVSAQGGPHYQFGLGWDSSWLEQQALPLTKDEGKISVSAFSILLRLAVVAWLVHKLMKGE